MLFGLSSMIFSHVRTNITHVCY